VTDTVQARGTARHRRLPATALAVGAVFGLIELVRVPSLATALAIGSAAIAAIIVTIVVLRMPATRRPPWLLLAAAMALTAVGDVIFGVIKARDGVAPAISPADVPYLAAYPVMVVGLLMFVVRGSRARVLDVLVDAGAVAILVGIGLWQVFVLAPGALVSGTTAERVVAVLYPAGDVIVIGGLVALFLANVGTAAVRWLLAYGLAMLAADLVFLGSAQFTALTDWTPVSQALYEITYWTLVAAALADAGGSSASTSAPSAVAEHTRRLPLLAIALLGAPALAVVVTATGNDELVPVFITAVLGICVLALIRLVSLVRGLERERALLKRAEQGLAHEATHDPLTGLPNRALFASRIPDLVDDVRRTGGSLAVLFIDLDEFKRLNDTFGHQAGDLLLRTAADRISAQRVDGDLVARVGGDEFVMVSSRRANPAELGRLSERLIQLIEEPVEVGEQQVQTTASIGYAVLGVGEDHHALLRNADLALFDAKAAGRRTSRMFSPSLRTAADERSRIEDGLRRALALDVGGLSVAYQPRVALDTGRIDSFEALVRWPERPDVPVQRLIEVAEDTGLIDALGRFVLDRAVGDCARLNADLDDGLSVAVNVSMHQLAHDDMTGLTREVIDRHGLAAGRLALEITETFIAHDPVWAECTLSGLRSLGVRIELDDFGTGYSSFVRLTQMPLDGLKIDRTFAHDLGSTTRADELVAAIVAVGRAADLSVTIEGVETDRQATTARGLGCDLAQGYVFARPMDVDALRRFIRDWRPPDWLPVSRNLDA